MLVGVTKREKSMVHLIISTAVLQSTLLNYCVEGLEIEPGSSSNALITKPSLLKAQKIILKEN